MMYRYDQYDCCGHSVAATALHTHLIWLVLVVVAAVAISDEDANVWCADVVRLHVFRGGVLITQCHVRTTTRVSVRSWSFLTWSSVTRASTSVLPPTLCLDRRSDATSRSLLNVSVTLTS